MKTLWKNVSIALALAAATGGSFVLAQSVPTLSTAAPAGARGTSTVTTARGPRGGPGEERQPRMRDALLSLNSARIALRDALPDKGGNREKALQSVEQAIKDVQAGIDYARDHAEEFPGTSARGLAPRGTSARGSN